MKKLLRAAVFLLIAGGWQSVNALDWPQEITADEGTIVVYQPQPESLEGNVLKGRAAMSLELKESPDLVFGVFWFSSRIQSGEADDTLLMDQIKVTAVAWPESKDAAEQRFTAVVEAAIPDAGFTISRDQLSASLETAKLETDSLANLNNDPPKIVFRDELAVLLLFEGNPMFTSIENSGYDRAINTPFAVARRNSSGVSYLSSGQLWYSATNPLGTWLPTTSPPADLVQMLPQADSATPPPSPPPAIVVATEPTELIATQGKPNWESLPGGALLYVSNTETPWLRELSTANMYVLLSGRWFRAKSQDGPWTFVRPDELPASFKDIPPASNIGGIRTSIAGTEEADNAVRDAQIPQTAAIKRDAPAPQIKYDGNPKFERIAGTDVAYAINTSSQVLKIDDRYYVVEDGVWFTAVKPEGAWSVADSIPSDKIKEIPPSSEVYNVRYVEIYDSTPEVVYVGYTPGYMWSYPYYGVPFYGTGWYYPPYWYGGIYYPRPLTWGFNVGYNPWTGWNYGLSWSNGFFSFGVRWGGGVGCCGGGWYGGGYRGPIFINTGDINIGNNVNIGNRDKIAQRLDKEGGLSNRDRPQNVYDRAANKDRVAQGGGARSTLQESRPAQNRANDVYADRNGNVARRDANSWETRQDGQWQRDPANSSLDFGRPASQPSRDLDRQQLNRDYSSRQQGAQRMNNRPRPSRGGGGRRR